MKHIITAAFLFPVSVAAAPLFPNSVASNDINFITQDDPSVFHCLQFDRRSRQEMPNVFRDDLFADDVFTYTAQFSDGTSIGIWADPAFAEETTAQNYARTVAHRVGQLPTLMRAPLQHIIINTGDAAATEEKDGGFFILYADNIDTRIANNDLSETIFHEAAHVALENEWIGTNDWQDAVAADPGFITDYAASNPSEDFAESALFAYTYLRHPERLPANVREAIETTMPKRMNVLDNIIVQWAPHVDRIGPTKDCT